MNLEDLKRIIVSFADNESDVIIDKGKILTQIREEPIEVTVQERDGELYCSENGKSERAIYWIANRLACLHQLADRILDYTIETKNFINPTGRLLTDVDIDPSETEKAIEDIPRVLSEIISQRIPGTSKVVYLTSDAGEGKTTLINQLARAQAKAYKSKQSRCLTVPIPLGGRPFLRFDDIVIASLVNRLRFRLFYYDSFIELVRLGLIIPAFDGFEEMFMESSTGEALSATGHLMSKLNSSGTILIAARKAYFDYKSFSSQAKLFDTIGANSVSFSKISINRWDKDQFIAYAKARGIENPSEVFEFVSKKLGGNSHPLLTRPVLVNRLLDVIHNTEDLDIISDSFNSTSYYFPKFVDTIIRREAETKWIDRSGEPYKPLLTVVQHYELLSVLAEEMWLNNTDTLQESVVDLISDIFCDSQGLSAFLSRQVKERLKQHALIVKADLSHNQFKFDHEEFKEFFLGFALFTKINLDRRLDVKHLLRKSVVYKQTVETVVSHIKGGGLKVAQVLELLNSIQHGEGPASFIRENNGSIIINLLEGYSDSNTLLISSCLFPSNSLHGIHFKNTSFNDSYFQYTSLATAKITNSIFENCNFERIEIDPTRCRFEGVIFKNCEVVAVQNLQKDITYYDPLHIRHELETIGIKTVNTDEEEASQLELPIESEIDERLVLTEKALRRFLRSTYINDSIFRIRLGTKADLFVKTILPVLLEQNVLDEVEYIGSGQARRFKLMIPFERISQALSKCNGNFDKFIKLTKS